jgi:hypothetical protein
MEPFFTLSGEGLIPAPHARGPWSPDMLHGRLIGGLLARAIEADHASEELVFARLTVDLFRSAPLTPLKITTDRVRDGRRIRVVDASVSGADGQVARASAVLLRKGDQPAGTAWPPQLWDVPTPAELGPPNSHMGFNEPVFNMWRIGEGNGAWDGQQQRRCWLQETHQLVGGEELSPLVRVALAADLASPLSHWTASGLNFINADYTINLSRPAEGDVIGVEAGGHLSADGIAAGRCILYDLTGPVGFCTTSALANPPLLTRATSTSKEETTGA